MLKPDAHSFSDLSHSKITHIDAYYSVDFQNKTLIGKVTYKLSAPAGTTFILDSKGLKIKSITSAHGQHSYKLSPTSPILGEKLTILNTSQLTEFCIEFETSEKSTALQWLDSSQTDAKTHPMLYTFCYPIHARSIVPIQDSPQVRITSSLEIQVPKPLTAIMAAAPGRVLIDSPTETTFRFEMPQPVPPYLFAFAVGLFESADVGPRTRVYAEPAVIVTAKNELANVDAILSAAENLFGPYQWERFDLLIMPSSLPYLAMENPRLISVSSSLLGGGQDLLSILSHELAHSWCGNLITHATWDDAWVSEGWTTYAERKIDEAISGPERAKLTACLKYNFMVDTMNRFGMNSEPTKLFFSKAGINPDDVFSNVPLEKGYCFLSELERTIGSSKFRGFVHRYINKFAFSSISTEDFLQFLAKELPEAAQLVDIDTWLKAPGLPPVVPDFSSKLIDNVNEAIIDFKKGKLPDASLVKNWHISQITYFLLNIPQTISISDCKQLEDLFEMPKQKDVRLLITFFSITIGSNFVQNIDQIKNCLQHHANVTFLKPIYSKLAQAPWSKSFIREYFESVSYFYHPIARTVVDTELRRYGV